MNWSESEVVATPRIPHSRSRTQRKTFSGCWTCRARHLKCDEARPRCRRCIDADLQCEGYEIRFSWRAVQNPTNYRRRTRHVARTAIVSGDASIGAASLLSGPSLGLARTTGRGENEEEDAQSPSLRAFAQPDNDGWHDALSLSPQDACDPSLDEMSADHGWSRHNEYATQSLHSPGKRLRTTGQLASIGAEAGTPDPPGDGQDQQGDMVEEYVLRPPAPSFDIETEDGVTAELDLFNFPPSPELVRRCSAVDDQQHLSTMQISRELDHLPDIRLECKLIEHWVLRMTDILMPIPGLQNPLRTVFTPIAFAGAQSDKRQSSGATALFHLICASSAYHLHTNQHHHEGIRSRGLEQLALSHHNCALGHLQENIIKQDPDQYEGVLASLVMCMFLEAVTVPTSFWRSHIRGARKWLNKIDRRTWEQSESSSTIYQMFTGITVFIQSHIILDEDANTDDLFFVDIEPLPGPYLLDQFLGISLTTLKNINAMNLLSLKRRRKQSQSSPVTMAGVPSTLQPPIEDSLDHKELEFYLSAPRKPENSGEMVYHYMSAYYFASLIYFKRVLRTQPNKDVQDLVEHSFDHIEALLSCTTRPFSPVLWPIAVTTFEASSPALQARIRSCLDEVTKRTGMQVWTNLKQLLSDLWEARVLTTTTTTTESQSAAMDLQWYTFFKGSHRNFSIMML